MYNNSLGRNIRLFRKLCGLTQADLAKKLFVSPQNLSKWERGTTNPDIWNLYRLSEVLGVSCDKLLGKFDDFQNSSFMIACDGGATKTEFILFSDRGDIVKRMVLSGSNPNAFGLQGTLDVLKNGIDGMLSAGKNVNAMFLGIAGCGDAKHRKDVLSFLKQTYPEIKSDVRSDLFNVIHTYMPTECYASVVCGTGSIVGVKCGDEIKRIGGFGYLFDNSFSGYQLGRDALAAAMRHSNGFGEPTVLTELIENKFEGSIIENINKIYTAPKDFIASFAPDVFAAYDMGDCVAAHIVGDSIAELSRLINHALTTFNCSDEVVLSGGLTNRADILIPELEKHCSGIKFTITDIPQIYGAAIYCCEKYSSLTNQFKDNLKKSYDEISG